MAVPEKDEPQWIRNLRATLAEAAMHEEGDVVPLRYSDDVTPPSRQELVAALREMSACLPPGWQAVIGPSGQIQLWPPYAPPVPARKDPA